MKYKLTKYCQIFTGYTFRHPVGNIEDGMWGVINLKDLSNESPWINYPTLTRLADFAGDRKYILKDGDVLVTIRGNRNLAVLFESEQSKISTIASGAFVVIRPIREFVDSGYLAWYLNLPETQAYFKRASVGTTVQNLPISAVKDFELKVPDFHKQKTIGQIYLLHHREILAAKERETKLTMLLNEQLKSVIDNESK